MFYVGIDIAKQKYYVSIMNSDGEILVDSFAFANDHNGFHELLSHLECYPQKESFIGMKSTAHYVENLTSFLYTRGYSGIYGKVCYALLKEQPNPDKITTMHLTQLYNLLNKTSKSHFGKEYAIALKELAIQIIECSFSKQRGAYKVIKRNRFIFVKQDLHQVMKDIVIFHEIGHDALHRTEAKKVDSFQKLEIFNIRNNCMEYEANIFASQLVLSEDEFLDYCKRSYDVQQITRAMNSDINLVALKVDTLISQGYRLRQQEYRNDFLKYNK